MGFKQLEQNQKETIDFITNILKVNKNRILKFSGCNIDTKMFDNAKVRFIDELSTFRFFINRDLKWMDAIISLNEWNKNNKNLIGIKLQQKCNEIIQPSIIFVFDDLFLLETYSKNLYILNDRLYYLYFLSFLKKTLSNGTEAKYQKDEYDDLVKFINDSLKYYHSYCKKINERADKLTSLMYATQFLKFKRDSFEHSIAYGPIDSQKAFVIMFEDVLKAIKEIVQADSLSLISFLDEYLTEALDNFYFSYEKINYKMSQQVKQEILKYCDARDSIKKEMTLNSKNTPEYSIKLIDNYMSHIQSIVSIVKEKEALIYLEKYLVMYLWLFGMNYGQLLNFHKERLSQLTSIVNELNNSLKQTSKDNTKILNKLKDSIKSFDKSLTQLIKKEKEDDDFIIEWLIQYLSNNIADFENEWVQNELDMLKQTKGLIQGY